MMLFSTVLGMIVVPLGKLVDRRQRSLAVKRMARIKNC
jgi:hypothetical protein